MFTFTNNEYRLIEASKEFDKGDEISRLIQAGTNVNISDDSGWTSLHYASYLQYLSTVMVLLKNGANANVPALLGVASWASL